MKLNIKVLFVFLLGVFAFSSCSDESEMITEGELIGEKIIELTSKEEVNQATTYMIYYGSGFVESRPDEIEKEFQVEGPIIKIGSTYYNLNKLNKYEIVAYDGKKVLILYFEGSID